MLTGMGLVTPCGIGVEPFWDSLVHGRSGIGPLTLFDASLTETRIGGEVKAFDPLEYMERKEARRMGRFQQLAMAAAHLALEDGALACPPADPERAAVVIGSAVAGLVTAEREYKRALEHGAGSISPTFILQILGNMVPAYVSIRWGFKGTNFSTSSACATGAHAIGEAMRMIQFDHADIALAGGAEAPLGLMAIGGFNQLRALSTRNDEPERASRPFDRDRDGFVMSEGAAVLLLEELGHAESRGARIYGELCGYGTSSDAFHVTSPAPEHEGGQRCMRSALRDAGLQPADVGYVNAHAASTLVGDVLEVAALRGVFGEHTPRVPMSSTKSMTGHMMGAAGAAELAVTALALQRGVLPPTINLDSPEIAEGVDYVPNVARRASIEAAISNSFGFGGTNASLVLRKADAT